MCCTRWTWARRRTRLEMCFSIWSQARVGHVCVCACVCVCSSVLRVHVQLCCVSLQVWDSSARSRGRLPFHTQSRLQSLTWEMIRVDQKPPKLRAKGAETPPLGALLFRTGDGLLQAPAVSSRAHCPWTLRAAVRLVHDHVCGAVRQCCMRQAVSPILQPQEGFCPRRHPTTRCGRWSRRCTCSRKQNWTQSRHICATPHMTPTPKDPDSFAGWSDADVLQVSCGTHRLHDCASVSFWPGDRWRHVFGFRLHFYALSAIRFPRPSCYNVRAFPECSNDWLPRTRWNTCPLGGHVGLKSSDFTTVSLNVFRFYFLHVKRSSANFTLELQFLRCLENSGLQCKNCNALALLLLHLGALILTLELFVTTCTKVLKSGRIEDHCLDNWARHHVAEPGHSLA